MGSLFDSAVYARRNRTPFSTISFLSFLKAMVWNGSERPAENEVILRARYRHDVSSRVWYELEWTGGDEERHSASSQEFDLLMWRAAHIEAETQRKIRDTDKNITFVVSILGQRCDSDSEFVGQRIKAHMAAVRLSTEHKTGVIEVWHKQTGDPVLIVQNGWSFVPQGEGE